MKNIETLLQENFEFGMSIDSEMLQVKEYVELISECKAMASSLQGTEKQISYATQLREKYIGLKCKQIIGTTYDAMLMEQRKNPYALMTVEQAIKKSESIKNALLTNLKNVKSAAAWIEQCK